MFVSVRSKVFTDATGAFLEIPVLLTPAGILEPLLDYCLFHAHDRSLSWMGKVVRSVRMFLEYLQTNSMESEAHILFQSFAQRLYIGTFNRETGLDPSGLCWGRRSEQDARHIIGHLTDFFDWLATERPAAALINPKYTGGAFDRMMDEAAYQYRRNRALLGHIWAANATSQGVGRGLRSRRAPKVEIQEPPAFPEERFMDLLLDGFRLNGRPDYRSMLITLLLHGAGFRESEPFHLYVGDVLPDPINPRQALVRIHHPTYGQAPADWRDARGGLRNGNRGAYLVEKFGLAPRTELLGGLGAGWKGGTLDAEYYMQAYWFEPEYGELFMKWWFPYLEQVARIERHHPFAFINLRRDPIGGMYRIAQYNKTHAAACVRIGLKAQKALGTTPHGHRHAYAKRLTNAGISKALIRRFMHHASPESQDVYTQASMAEMRRELDAGARRLRQAHSQSATTQVITASPSDSGN